MLRFSARGGEHRQSQTHTHLGRKFHMGVRVFWHGCQCLAVLFSVVMNLPEVFGTWLARSGLCFAVLSYICAVVSNRPQVLAGVLFARVRTAIST